MSTSFIHSFIYLLRNQGEIPTPTPLSKDGTELANYVFVNKWDLRVMVELVDTTVRL